MRTTLRWFCSGTVRQASDLCHRVKKILYAQWDVLSPPAREAIGQAMQKVRGTIASGAEKTEILQCSENLESVANKWLKPYPNAGLRENVDVILVALVVAMGVRTFFLQPMAIPTGSMQPTLYGIMPSTSRTPIFDPDLQVPSLPVRIFDSLVRGTSYYRFVARADGEFEGFTAPETVFPFVKRQRFTVGSETYTIWFPPEDFEKRAAVPKRSFRAGEVILSVKVTSGDRLFVDRLTYNFRRPERGEIIIFQTNGIVDEQGRPLLQQGTHYIKRLIGLGGETLRLGDDRHVIVDGVRLDASMPHFENVYGFDPKTGPAEDRYSGHVNNAVGERARSPRIAPLFKDETAEFRVRPGHYFVLGDNTMNSYDSRFWGDFPQEKVVGKCFFVFWPITSRFGWAVR